MSWTVVREVRGVRGPSGKCLVTFERRTVLGDFSRQIWALMASTSRWNFENQTLDSRKCTKVHFRLLFELSVTLKVIGGPLPDAVEPSSTSKRLPQIQETVCLYQKEVSSRRIHLADCRT